MPTGSNLFSKKLPAIAHLSTGELDDLRKDVASALAPLAAIGVQEWVDPPAAAAAGLLAATASTVAPQTQARAALIAGGLAALKACPRNLVFTTAGTTPADAPANVVVTGKDINGNAITETITLAQTAAAANGVKAFADITSVVYPAGDGTGATIAIGTGNALGLSKKPKARAGLAGIIREIAIGAVVTTGAVDATNSTYTPAAAPNGTNDYAVYLEYDPTV